MLKNNLLLKTLLNQAEKEYNKKFQYCIFPQVWPNTGLGYSLVGCDVLTAADTIVLFCNEGPALVYYESDKLAYKVEKPNKQFFIDICQKSLYNQNIYEE